MQIIIAWQKIYIYNQGFIYKNIFKYIKFVYRFIQKLCVAYKINTPYKFLHSKI